MIAQLRRDGVLNLPLSSELRVTLNLPLSEALISKPLSLSEKSVKSAPPWQ